MDKIYVVRELTFDGAESDYRPDITCVSEEELALGDLVVVENYGSCTIAKVVLVISTLEEYISFRLEDKRAMPLIRCRKVNLDINF